MEHPVEGVKYVWKDGVTGFVYIFSNINKKAGKTTVRWDHTGILENYRYRKPFKKGLFTPLYQYQENV